MKIKMVTFSNFLKVYGNQHKNIQSYLLHAKKLLYFFKKIIKTTRFHINVQMFLDQSKENGQNNPNKDPPHQLHVGKIFPNHLLTKPPLQELNNSTKNQTYCHHTRKQAKYHEQTEKLAHEQYSCPPRILHCHLWRKRFCQSTKNTFGERTERIPLSYSP